MTIKVTTPPAVPALSLDSLKEHLRVIGTDEDSTLQLKLDAAIEIFQQYTSRALIDQTVEQSFDLFPCERNFLLERSAKTISGLTIEYYDDDNALTTFDASKYAIADSDVPAKVFLLDGESWPSDIHDSRPKAVLVTYTVGEGAAETDVPAKYRHALTSMVGDFQNFREDSMFAPGGTIVEIPWSSAQFITVFRTQFYEWKSQSRKARASNQYSGRTY